MSGNDYLSVEAYNSALCLFKFHCRRINEMLFSIDSRSTYAYNDFVHYVG